MFYIFRDMLFAFLYIRDALSYRMMTNSRMQSTYKNFFQFSIIFENVEVLTFSEMLVRTHSFY